MYTHGLCTDNLRSCEDGDFFLPVPWGVYILTCLKLYWVLWSYWPVRSCYHHIHCFAVLWTMNTINCVAVTTCWCTQMYCSAWEKAFFTFLCTNAGSNSNMACMLRLYMCVCCKYANLVEIATCVRAQRYEKRLLSITAIHQHGDCDTDVSGNVTKIYGTASL